ncbi:unnamed protein product [Nezara viridula]|uniref:Uncharacterized protein n=1 Tax=Nezara viridula TaxID=85310 RepID=A0A9P0H9V3_NEZVI|nr:unnamed protein product [Nezara viridula]
MEANYCIVPPTNFIWCCDIISRLNNDIQSLAHDLQILFKLQQCYVGLQKQFDQLYSQLEKKLEVLSSKKVQLSIDNERITPIHVEEFIIFIRKVCKSLSENLRNENGKARFISYVRGLPLKSIVDDLMNFCFHCSRTFLPKFYHHQCSQVFTTLANQLNYYVFPEVEFVDSFEQSLKYLTSSLPCMINLLTIVDLYLYCPKYDRIETLCNDLFTTTPPVEATNFIPFRLLMFPDSLEGDSELFGDVDFDYISYWVPKMVTYIMRMSVVPRKFSTISSRPHGILNSNYMVCTRISQQDFVAEGSPGYERKRIGKRRGYVLGRRRSLNNKV